MAFLTLFLLAQDLDRDYLRDRERIDRDYARDVGAVLSRASRLGVPEEAVVEARLGLRIKPDDSNLQRILDGASRQGENTAATAVVIDVRAGFDTLRQEFAVRYRELAEEWDGGGEAEGADARLRAEWLENEDAGPEPQPEEGNRRPRRPGRERPESGGDGMDGGRIELPSTVREMLWRVGDYRSEVELPEAAYDEALTRGAQAHADYLVQNPDAIRGGLDAHNEEPGRPGYTAGGAQAGRNSDIGYEDPAQVVDGWMATLYHRIPILRPNVRRIGMGYTTGGPYGHICVLDVVSGIEGEIEGDGIIAYPPDGADTVPQEFGGEVPDPVPSGEPRPAGYPITLTFYRGESVTGVTAELLLDDAPVACHVSDPEHPATDFPQQDTICLIPQRPLAGQSRYRVRVACSVNGEPRAFEWSFTTGG